MTENNFFTKLPYLIILSIITLVLWTFDLANIGMLVYIGVVFILLIFMRNSIYIIPFILNALFMISQTEWDISSIPIYLYIAPAVIIIGIVVNMIRFKVNIFRGKLFIGLAILVFAMITSNFINNPVFDLNFYLILIGSLFFLFLYGFFANTIVGDNLMYLIRIFVILGVMISLQVFLFYVFKSENTILYDLEHKTIDLGWGISNFIATYLILFISTMTYFIKKYKLHIFWIIIFLFEIAMLLFTLSRAGLLSFLATSVLLILFMFIKYEHKLVLFVNLIVGILIASVVGYFAREYFIEIWNRLELFGLDDTGRIEIWYDAIDKFKASPIFGGGFFAREAENELRMFHNTILHTLACFGIVGGIGLLIQFVSVLRVFLHKINQEKAILFIALIGVNIHGMVDNIYFMPQYMIIMFIIIAVVENANKIDDLRHELRLG